MRPRLHFTAETGWVNDPHGITFHDGAYHLFHQYVPDSLTWAPNCHWGHATSTDLVNWTARPVAIAPGDGDHGIWTGSLVQDGPRARILYTSVTQPNLGLGAIRLAFPTDSTWDTWTKGEVVARPPEDLELIAYRDPFVIREGRGWRMFVGAASRDGDALALTYTSPDLTDWTFDGVALERSTHETHPTWMGALWECPQILDVDDHWAMISSVWDDDVLHYAGYALGGSDSYDHGRLAPTNWGQLSHGGSYYAPSVFRDQVRRPCLMFWMRGVADEEAGWASCLSVPYVLNAFEGRIVATPHPELTARRGAPLPPGARSAAFDIEWTPAGTGDDLTLGSASEKTVRITADHGFITLERIDDETWTMLWTGGSVRVIVDGPVLEISTSDGLLGGAIVPGTDSWFPVRGAASAWCLEVEH